MEQDSVAFDFEESPSWRAKELAKTTSELVKDISTYRERYEKLPDVAKKFCEDEFARAMAVDSIYNLNIGELVGTQTMDGTKAVLESLLQRNEDGGVGSEPEMKNRPEKLETINTFKAMKHLYEVTHKEMDRTGFLTVQQICDVHKVLLTGLHSRAGELRQTEVFTNWRGGVHYYPHPKVAGQKIYGIIDQHNIHMDSRPKTTLEDTVFVFKSAAWLLFQFVDTHPFPDGNGRMCRLLANCVVSLITPFPISLYHTKQPHRSGREEYINAIVRCRDHPKEGPGELAAMLVEGAWHGWENLFSNLEHRQEMKVGVVVMGPVVVQKSKLTQVEERLQRVSSISEGGFNKEELITTVSGVTLETDVERLKPHQYVEKYVPLDKDTQLLVKIFP